MPTTPPLFALWLMPRTPSASLLSPVTPFPVWLVPDTPLPLTLDPLTPSPLPECSPKTPLPPAFPDWPCTPFWPRPNTPSDGGAPLGLPKLCPRTPTFVFEKPLTPAFALLVPRIGSSGRGPG